MAIGSGSEGANTALQEEYKAELSLEEAEVLVLKTLKQVMEEKVQPLAEGHKPSRRVQQLTTAGTSTHGNGRSPYTKQSTQPQQAGHFGSP